MSEYTYEIIETKDVDPNIRTYGGFHLRGMVESRTFILRGDDAVTVGKAAKIAGTAKSGKNWCRWQTIDQLRVTTRPRGNGPARLNAYSITNYPAGRTFFNATAQMSMMSHNLSGNGAERFMQYVDEMYRKNIDPSRGIVLPDKPTELPNDGTYVRPGTNFDDWATGTQRASYGWSITRLAYPIIDLFDQQYGGEYHLPSNLTLALREKDIASYARAAFGKSRYRRDLARTLAETHPFDVARVQPFSGIVPTDWIIEVLKDMDPDDGAHRAKCAYGERPFHRPSYRRFLAAVPDSRKRSVFKSIFDAEMYMCDDTVRMFDRRLAAGNLTDAQMRHNSIRDIHDAVMPAPNQRYQALYLGTWKEPVNEQLPGLHEVHNKIESLELPDGMRFVLPTDTDTLRKWGNDMGNCIGSYDDKAVSGLVILPALLDKNGKMIANLELQPSPQQGTDLVLRQFLGKHNRTLDKDVLVPVLKAMIHCSLIDANLYGVWGVPPEVAQHALQYGTVKGVQNLQGCFDEVNAVATHGGNMIVNFAADYAR